jgi:2-polyprenyl-3-methyl-5-hydroxy-6-metoxy-1,4-benzoquinol methylase
MSTIRKRWDKNGCLLCVSFDWVHLFDWVPHFIEPAWLPHSIQDVTRTGTYYSAILDNRADFEGKTVMDVGAGSGILSLFAAQVS